MKIDSELLEQAKKEYHDLYGYADRGSLELLDWSIKKICGIAKLSNGLMFVIDKPSIETKFCFGYGMNGKADDKSAEDAHKAKDGMNEKDNFIKANFEKFDNNYRLLNSGKDLYYYRLRRNQKTPSTNLIGICESEKAYYGVVGKMSNDDVAVVRTELARVRDDFAKRLETYWKRYGATKLKTWTYLED